jgi:hypothetical protein
MARIGVSILLALAFGMMGMGCRTVSGESVGIGGEADGGGKSGKDSDRDKDSDRVEEPETDVDKDAESAGNPDSDGDGDRDTDSDVDGDSDIVVDTAFAEAEWDSDVYRATDTSPEDTRVPDGGYPDVCWVDLPCAEWELHVKANPSSIMILQDVSRSMGQGTPTKWEHIQSALLGLLDTFGFTNRVQLGFDVFPNRPDCAADDPLVIDSAAGNGQSIFDLLPLVALGDSTPLLMAMKNFLDASYAPVFTDKAHPSYLIVVSDGKDTCGDAPGHLPGDELGAGAAQLGTLARALLEDTQIFTVAIGFGDEADPEQLDAIAQNGGTDFDQYLEVHDRLALESVLHELVAYTIDCQFDFAPEMRYDSGSSIIEADLECIPDIVPI